MSSFHKLSVKNIKRETDKAISISFNLPENLKDTFAFQAGQYITLKTDINGNEVRRDYSLCVSPKSGDLKIAVKEVKDGTFSAYANNTLNAGDTLEVAPPKGRFVFEPNDSKTKNIALFAAGSGITPILSIIKCALEEEVHSKVILVYGNKTTKDTMFLNELLELQHAHKDRFSIQFVFSQQDEDDAIFGRIEKSTVNYVMKNKHKHVDVDAFYLCGPEAMIQTTTFEMSQKQTILEAALDEDLDAPYSCQGGICSSCLAKVTEGSATMRQNNILTESEVAEGLILTCQAHPTTPTIAIDFDDV